MLSTTPHCVRKYKQTAKTHVSWIEKRLYRASDFLYYYAKTFKFSSKVPVPNVTPMHCSCAFVFLWDGPQSQWSLTLERCWHSERGNRAQTQATSLRIRSGHWPSNTESLPWESSKKKKKKLLKWWWWVQREKSIAPKYCRKQVVNLCINPGPFFPL